MKNINIYLVFLCIVIFLLIFLYLISNINTCRQENFDETTEIGKQNADYIRSYLKNRYNANTNPNGYDDEKLQNMIKGLGETDPEVIACLDLQPTPCIECLGKIFGMFDKSLENGLVIHYTFEQVDFDTNNKPIIMNKSTKTLDDDKGKQVPPDTYNANIISATNNPQNVNNVIDRSSGNVVVNSGSLSLEGAIRPDFNFNPNKEITNTGYSANNAAYLSIPTFPTFYNKVNQFLGMAFSFWFKSTNSGVWTRIFDFGNNRDSDNLLISNSEGGGKTMRLFNVVNHWSNDNGGQYDNNLDGRRFMVCDNVWRHIVWNNDMNGNVTLYVNNAPVSRSRGMPRNVVRKRNYIGKSNWNSETDTNNVWNSGPFYNDDMFNGSIADFRVYQRSLTDDDVEKLYKMGNKIILSKPITTNYLGLSNDIIDTGTTPGVVNLHGSVPIGLYKGRRAAYFNNSKGNYLSMPFTSTTMNNFSFGFWLYGLDGNYYTAVSITNNGWNPSFQCDMHHSEQLAYICTPYHWQLRLRGNASYVGNWVHIAYTFGQDNIANMFINGNSVNRGQGHSALNLSPTKFIIGRSGDHGRAFHGYIYGFFYNNKTMTDFEIMHLYKTSMENSTNC